MESFLQDLRYAARTLRKSPGFALVAVLTLALGIGAATATFSLVNTLLLRPLPLGEADRMVRMRDAVARPGQEPWLYNTSPRSFFALKEQATVFEGVVAQRFRVFNLTGTGDPARVDGIGVSADWTETLRVQPILGRGFSPEEERLGRDSRVVLVGYGLWQRRYGGNPGLVGRTLTLNGEPYSVIGVMPRWFNYPYGSQLWVPETFDRNDAQFGPNVAARLRPGITVEEAQRELDLLSARLQQEFPDTHASVTLTAVPIREDLVHGQHRFSLILLAAVGFLLLIACANVANLLLVRSLSRRREIAIRAALGARRGRQVRQLLTESLVLALIATALGLFLAWVLTDSITALSLPESNGFGAFFRDVRVDGRVVAFSLFVTLLTSAMFGLVPALWSTNPDLHTLLKAGGRSSSAPGNRPLRVLATAEVALALVLLTGAGFMLRDLRQLQQVDLGYEAENRIVFHLSLPENRYPEDADRVRFVDQVTDRVEAVPGVIAAGVTNLLPLREGSTSIPITIEGGPASEPGNQILVNHRAVTADYLPTMGTPLLRGRLFDMEERSGQVDVVVISNRMAERFWPGQDPIGRRLKIGGLDSPNPWLTVVGVAADVAEGYDLDMTLYSPYGRNAAENLILVVRSPVEPAMIAPTLRSAIWDVDADQPVERVAMLPELVTSSLAGPRMGSRILGIFAAVGLLLATLGIYGVISHGVSQRRHEIGIRRAIGATPTAILGLVLRQCAALIAVGLIIGLPVSLLATDLLVAVLEVPGSEVPAGIRTAAEATALGPAAYAALAVLVAAVALLAAYLPARRATRVDPMIALRSE